ncbi:hypothetical protein Rleg5DRAFT_6710 [Rhizobium leguminosarum bv. viciae WSM1455]|nr:hypothetical protein Rleg5DRAFT_6710 [Rhizobium leguminosarum bv. viciae WSM1455]
MRLSKNGPRAISNRSRLCGSKRFDRGGAYAIIGKVTPSAVHEKAAGAMPTPQFRSR